MDDTAVRTPNADRGELVLVLDNTRMGLRPTFEAIEAIEQQLGRGLVDVARDALADKLTIGEAAQVACECIRAFGSETGDKGLAGANPKRIARLIYDSEGGLLTVTKTLSALLSIAVTGGYDASGNLKPTATMTTTEAAPAVG